MPRACYVLSDVVIMPICFTKEKLKNFAVIPIPGQTRDHSLDSRMGRSRWPHRQVSDSARGLCDRLTVITTGGKIETDFLDSSCSNKEEAGGLSWGGHLGIEGFGRESRVSFQMCQRCHRNAHAERSGGWRHV